MALGKKRFGFHKVKSTTSKKTFLLNHHCIYLRANCEVPICSQINREEVPVGENVSTIDMHHVTGSATSPVTDVISVV